MSHRPHRRSSAAFAAAALLVFAACRSAPDQDGSAESASGLTPVQFADIPIPDGMVLETQMHRSFTYEVGDFRLGDLYYYGNLPIDSVASYMSERMALHGWKQVGEDHTERATDLHFERRPHRADCRIWKDDSDVTRMHIAVSTAKPGQEP